MDTLERTRRPVLGAVVVLALAGCTGTSPVPSQGSGQPSGPAETTLGSPSASPNASPQSTVEPSIVPTTTPTPAASGPAQSLPPAPTGAWRPVPTQTAVAATQLQDVIWTGTRFEAVGDATSGGAFLDSTDGRTWRLRSAGRPDAIPTRIAAASSGLVAIGTIGGRYSSWVSPDGIHWSWHVAAFPGYLDGPDRVTVTDVIATPTGWLAVGRDDPACAVECDMTPIRSLAWTSTDGLSWTRVTGQTALATGGINAIAADDQGFTAVGTAAGHAAIWITPDGLSWSRVADSDVLAAPGGSAKGAMVTAQGVASGFGSIVVVGMVFGANAQGVPVVVAWRSSDGATWTRAAVAGAEGGQVFSVAATSGRFLATGPSGDGSCLGGIWASSDGAAWACEASDPAFAGFGPYAGAGSPTTEVAVGLTSAGWDSSTGQGMPGAIWYRPAP